MFNNPLRKYQSGGTTPSPEQQQLLMAFVEWLPKRVKEFANMAPEQIVETLNGMSQSPEGQKQVEQLMQQFKQEISGAQPSQFAKGGKLHNFICKYAKGGYLAGCGCNEKGGKVRSAQNGTSGIPQNSAALDMYLMNNMQMPNSGNLFTGQQVASIINGMHLNQPLVQTQEDGGKVEVAQKGKLLQDGNYTVQVNAPGDTTRTIYNKYNRQIMQTYPDGSVRYTTMSNNGNDDYQVNTWTGRPSWTKRIWFGNKRATPEKVNAWNEEIASRAIDPRNIVSKENGGVVKGQGGLKAVAKWIRNANGSRTLVDNTGKVIMREVAPGMSGASREASKILERREPFETANATDYANRMMVIRENTDLPWAAKQSAYERINPYGQLFQPWKPRVTKVDIKKPE